MSSVHQNLSSNKMVNAENIGHFRFTIIKAAWNAEVTDALQQGCIETFTANGIPSNQITCITVPGSWELISAAHLALNSGVCHAVICIGAVVRGDTPHFDYICQGVTQGLAQLCGSQPVPVIFGVLTVNTMQQALDRCGGVHGNKGVEAAYTAIEMALLAEKLLSK
ncbi:MAG: 6,7-dimethyl-8-ribityllumazine synthase [Bacteroidia bacterium]|jgi:6,7-dimethyl-8-ribityllumazine synthase